MSGALDRLRAMRAEAPACPEPRPEGSLVAPVGTRAQSWQLATASDVHERLGCRPAVGPSPDLTRVLALPRRPRVNIEDGDARAAALVALMTERLGRDRGGERCKCEALGRACILELKPVQAWALWEASVVGGLSGLIGVGHGKTGLDILAPMVVRDCKVAVLLIPPGLRDQLVRDYLAWREHFRVPSLVMDDGRDGHIVPGAPVLHVVPFSRLSRPESTALLDGLNPDTFVIDEADQLSNPGAARTGRVLRYLQGRAERGLPTRYLWWSGTPTKTSIKDYAHHSAFALGEGSPVPIDPDVVAEWALAIDPSEWQAPIGALAALCAPGEHIYDGFNRRLVETRGVVTTVGGAVSVPLFMRERKVDPPAVIVDLLKTLRDPDAVGGWTRPDGEEFMDALSVQACARQLACGFYYRWKYPRGESEELIERWFAARKAWHAEVREKLKRPRAHLDSPLLCQNAARRYHGETILVEGDDFAMHDGPVWAAQHWPAWAELRDQVQPEPEAVWVDDFLVSDAAEWAHAHKGVVWYTHGAFGRRLEQLSGLPRFGGGKDAAVEILQEDGSRSVIASVKAHGRGRDGLQWRFREQLFTTPLTDGSDWEQLLGRLHRVGQAAASVEGWVYRHTQELRAALDTAHRRASYVQGTMGTLMKLLSLDCDFRMSAD